MFGYVVVNKPELKIKEFQEYQSYYCGLCRALKNKCGICGQISLSYDMTFLALLLSKLYEPEEIHCECRCVVHPLTRHTVRKSDLLDYVADMNLLMTWYKCKDDFLDEGNVIKGLYGKSIATKVRTVQKQYERQYQAVCVNLEHLSVLEREHSTDIDVLSSCFGYMLSELFVIDEDEWSKYLRKIGFYLGKFIYILDAYEDLQKDKQKQCFNPFFEKEKMKDYDDWVKQLLVMAAAELAKEFEKLPIIEGVEILRNIIYSGIWTRYESVRKHRQENIEKKNEKSI